MKTALRSILWTLPALALAWPAAAGSGSGNEPIRQGDPLRVQVQPGASGNNTMVFVTKGDDGAHRLQLQARDGKVVVDSEPDPGRVWLGVLLSKSDEEMAPSGAGHGRSYRFDNGTGQQPERASILTITSVAKSSPASRAGLEAGDVITGIEGRTLARRAEEGRDGLLDGFRPGDTVSLDIARGGDARRVRVKLGGHPGKVEFESAEGLGAFAFAGDMLGGLEGLEALESLKELRALPCPPGSKPEDCNGYSWMFHVGGGGPRLGVHVASLSEQLARYFGVEPGRGLLVQEVLADTPAARAGIMAGDVITRVGTNDVRAVGDVHAAMKDLEKGDSVSVEVMRRGEARTFQVTVDEAARKGELIPGFLDSHEMPQVNVNIPADLDARVREAIQRAAEAASEAGNALSSDAYRKAIERAHEAAADDEAHELEIDVREDDEDDQIQQELDELDETPRSSFSR